MTKALLGEDLCIRGSQEMESATSYARRFCARKKKFRVLLGKEGGHNDAVLVEEGREPLADEQVTQREILQKRNK